ncbi:synaptotagmin-5-like isoform X1 [Diadema antillarum]|uniref:synaptotagmin-5-like isoform X1 n=1 Tax=Diadema antillarum TaxID=105358 RepID=UPI003A8ACC11
MAVQLTVIFGVCAGVAAIGFVALVVFLCYFLRARRKKKRQKRRAELERVLGVTPLKSDFYRDKARDEHPKRLTLPQQPTIDDHDSDALIDEAIDASSPQPNTDYIRSQSWTATPAVRPKLAAIDAQRRKTLAVSSLTPSSSDSSLASMTSEPELDQLGHDSDWLVSPTEMCEKPVLHFSLFMSTRDDTLYVTLKSVSGLARKYYPGCTSFLKVRLLPKFKDGFQTDAVRKSLNPYFNESFQFCKLSLAEAQGSFLKVKLYIKDKYNRKARFSGEVFAECHQLIDKSDRLLDFQRTFSTKRTKLPKKNLKRMSLPCLQQMRSKSTSELTSRSPYLGDLFVSLQYQASADRLKVMVRKAENLMVDTVVPGTGDFYVSVRLLKHREVMDEHSTQRRSGTSPVWNQPFLFHPESSDLPHISLLLAIHRGRRVASDVMVGKVEMGPGSGETGTAHWEEMLRPRGTEVAKWHRIKPPFS